MILLRTRRGLRFGLPLSTMLQSEGVARSPIAAGPVDCTSPGTSPGGLRRRTVFNRRRRRRMVLRRRRMVRRRRRRRGRGRRRRDLSHGRDGPRRAEREAALVGPSCGQPRASEHSTGAELRAAGSWERSGAGDLTWRGHIQGGALPAAGGEILRDSRRSRRLCSSRVGAGVVVQPLAVAQVFHPPGRGASLRARRASARRTARARAARGRSLAAAQALCMASHRAAPRVRGG